MRRSIMYLSLARRSERRESHQPPRLILKRWDGTMGVQSMNGVYFIQDFTNRAVKIGYSDSIESRLSSLQTANPNKLEIIAVWHNATMEQEKELHSFLGMHMLNREWFSIYGITPFIEWACKYVP